MQPDRQAPHAANRQEGCFDCPHPDYCAEMEQCEIGAAKLADRDAASVDHEERLREYAEWGGKDSTYRWALDEIERLRAWKEARIENHPTDTEFYGR